MNIEGMKRDIAKEITLTFDTFEQDNYCLPTVEEFRKLFENYAEQYIGEEQVQPEYLSHQQHQRESIFWQAVMESEAEQRYLRSQS